MKYFKKISGYKIIGSCKNCGTKLVSKTETKYCDACIAKLRSWREQQEQKEE